MKTKFIYSLSCPETKIVKYIGKTNNINRRLRNHVSNNSLSNSTKKNNWIISLLRRNLIPLIEIIDEVEEYNIDFWEKFYISLFKTWGFELLNGTEGGDGYDWTGRSHNEKSNLKNRMNSPNRKSVAQYDLNDNFIKEYYSLNEAGIKNGINKAHISRVCRGIQKTSGGFKWIFIKRLESSDVFESNDRVIKYDKPRIDNRIKKIKVFNLFGDLVGLYNGLTMASKKTGCHIHLIKNCCEKKGYYQTKNLTFRYEYDSFDYVPHKHYRKTKTYSISMYNNNKEFIKDFTSLKSVVLFTKIGKQYISKNCKVNLNDFKTQLKGYYFRFTI